MGVALDAANDLRRAFETLTRNLPRIVKQESDFAIVAMRKHFRPYSPNAPKSRTWLQDRAGMLSNSLANHVASYSENIVAKFFLNSAGDDVDISAWVNEFGANGIHGNPGDRDGKMHIPVGPALDSRGVRRYHRVRDAYKDYFLLFLDNVILGRRWGHPNDDMKVMWVRAEVVDVDARPFVRPELQEALVRLENRVDKLMASVGV